MVRTREFTKLPILFYLPAIFHNVFLSWGKIKRQGGMSSQISALITGSEAVTIQAAWQGPENHETANQETWAWHRCAARGSQSLGASTSASGGARRSRQPGNGDPGLPASEDSALPTPAASLPTLFDPQSPSSALAHPQPSSGVGGLEHGSLQPWDQGEARQACLRPCLGRKWKQARDGQNNNPPASA